VLATEARRAAAARAGDAVDTGPAADHPSPGADRREPAGRAA
jgi:hypothetical protein